jgi:Tfp pilus assembly protein PilF
MKNRNQHKGNFKLDLIVLILLVILFGTSVATAQSDLQTGKEIFEKKNYYGAKKFFNDYLKNDPENAEAYYYLGRIAMEEDDLELATDHFDKATDLDDARSEYFTWQGIAYVQLLSTVDFMKQGMYAPRALNSLEKAVNLDPNNIDARMWLGGYYAQAPVFAGGSKDKTREQYTSIMLIDPSFVPAYVNYGIALLGFEEYDEAYTNFEHALELDPENYTSYLFIGKLSAESGKYSTQGELALKKFIDLAPAAFDDSKDEAWWYLGTIYLQENQAEDARAAYEKAIALDPEKEDYQKSLKKLM